MPNILKLLLAVLCCTSFRSIVHAQPPLVVEIYDKKSKEPFKFSDIFQYQGFTKLELKGSSYIYSPDKILFHNDKIFILNAAGREQENILIFNKSDGTLFNTVGRSGNGPGEYFGIRDISLDECQDGLTIFVITKLSFQNYTLDAEYKDYQKVSVSLSEFEILEDGYKVIYNENEPGAYDASGLYYITILNPEGQIYNSMIPFLEEWTKVHMAYSFTGSLSKFGALTLFVPPFGEEIFAINKNGAQSIYRFDFGNHEIPSRMRKHPLTITPMGTIDNSYLTTNFFKLKNYLFFGFKDKRRMTHGIINETNQKVHLATSASKGPLKKLFTYLAPNRLFPVNENTVALYIDPKNL